MRRLLHFKRIVWELVIFPTWIMKKMKKMKQVHELGPMYIPRFAMSFLEVDLKETGVLG